MSILRPADATHYSNVTDEYYKPKAIGEGWMRWGAGTGWYPVGDMAEGALTILEPAGNKWRQLEPSPRFKEGQRLEMPAPVDELGKVWDELHTAGVNSGGTMAASEGVKELAEATRLLLKLFNANDSCAGADGVDPAVSQWLGSPLRTEIETYLGLKPVDPVEAQLHRDELLYGNSYALRNDDGTMTRLDPTLIIIRQRKL